eukprot:761056-Hanusia_phi.AAC.1
MRREEEHEEGLTSHLLPELAVLSAGVRAPARDREAQRAHEGPGLHFLNEPAARVRWGRAGLLLETSRAKQGPLLSSSASLLYSGRTPLYTYTSDAQSRR